MEVTGKKNDGMHISVPQLADVIASVGLKMVPKEIELLCTGFASDGEGKIDSKEFCEMVKTLLYNLVGEHAARQAETLALQNSHNQSNEYYKLMEELCRDIVTHDKYIFLNIFSLYYFYFLDMQ